MPQELQAEQQPPSRQPLSADTAAGASVTRAGRARAVARRVLVQREAALAGFVVVFCVALTIYTPDFLTRGNIEAVLLGMSVEGLIAIGMTVLLAAGGFDLSVGSVLAFGGVAGGLLVLDGLPAAVSIVLAVAVCAAIGAVNGFLVAKAKINCFVVTLAALSIVQGAVLLAAGGFGVTNLPAGFTVIGQKTIATVQLPIIILIVLAVLGDFLMRRSRIFRYPYYVGSNERAARLTGIPVERVQMLGYVLTAALAGFSGVLEAARFGSASVEVGQNTPLDVIAAVVIGGASLAGGSGTVLGSMLGVLLLQLIINALNLLGVATYWQPIATGFVLVAAVGFDVVTGRVKVGRLRSRLRLRSRASLRAVKGRATRWIRDISTAGICCARPVVWEQARALPGSSPRAGGRRPTAPPPPAPQRPCPSPSAATAPT